MPSKDTPSNTTRSCALISTFPPSPFPAVVADIKAPLVTSREPVSIVTPPASPTAPVATELAAELEKPFDAPSNTTLSFAVIFTLPAFPVPSVLADITAPLVTSREPVSIVTPPAFPSASFWTELNAALGKPFDAPSNTILSCAVISTLPAFPLPKVSADITAPLVTSREPVVIFISPASPTAVDSTKLNAPLRCLPSEDILSNTIVSCAVISTLPAFPFPWVLTDISPPLVTVREPVLIVTFPASPSAPTLNMLDISLGKLFDTPSSTIFSAVIFTLPPFPLPRRSEDINAPSLIVRELVLIVTSPASPSPTGVTILYAPLR